jgi:hypothetical protein
VTVGAAIVVHRIMIPETTIPGASCRQAVKLQRPALAQRQQVSGLIDLNTGEHHGGDGAVAQAARQQSQRQDLPSQIASKVLMRTKPQRLGSRPRAAASAVTATAWFPFSEAATGCGTNTDYRETPSEASNISGARRWQSARKSLSELGRQIAVDLESDAYFD